MLHDYLVKRRGIKNDLRKANAILGMSYEQIVCGEIDKAFDEVESQTYEPRILPELFERKKA